MLTPEEISAMSADLLDIYEQIESDLLVNVSRRFSVLDEIAPDTVAEWQVKMLEELGALRTENYNIIASHSGKVDKEITRILTDAGYGAIQTDDVVYNLAYSKGLLTYFPILARYSSRLQHIIDGAIKNTREYFNLVNTTALQSTQKEFIGIINQVYLETSAGIYDYDTAIRKAVKDLSDKGFTGATYSGINKNGKPYKRNDPLDVAVRRNIVTSTSQTAGKMQLERAQEWGSNLVEVTNHMGARPTHAVWQGKIYSIKGDTSEYPNLEATTDYGSVTGLKGANCAHDFYPFFPGLSVQRYYPYDEKENRRVYLESQEQRKLEREIRKIKRNYTAADAIGDSNTANKAKKNLQNKRNELDAFLQQTGRTSRANRTQAHGFGRSEGARTRRKL